MLLTKFQFIWLSGFRGEDFQKLTNQKQELPVIAMFLNESGQRAFFIEDLPRMLSTKFQFIWLSSYREEDFQKSTNQKQELPMAWQPCLFKRIGTKLAIFIEDLPYMFPTKFRFIWLSSFREEDFQKSTNQKQELPIAAMFVNRSG